MTLSRMCRAFLEVCRALLVICMALFGNHALLLLSLCLLHRPCLGGHTTAALLCADLKNLNLRLEDGLQESSRLLAVYEISLEVWLRRIAVLRATFPVA